MEFWILIRSGEDVKTIVMVVYTAIKTREDVSCFRIKHEKSLRCGVIQGEPPDDFSLGLGVYLFVETGYQIGSLFITRYSIYLLFGFSLLQGSDS